MVNILGWYKDVVLELIIKELVLLMLMLVFNVVLMEKLLKVLLNMVMKLLYIWKFCLFDYI